MMEKSNWSNELKQVALNSTNLTLSFQQKKIISATGAFKIKKRMSAPLTE